MKTLKIFYTFLLTVLLLCCKDQLDIQNPNQPTPASIKTEQGIISLAQGGLYVNGLQSLKFGGTYFGLALRYHELMGDVIGTPIANFRAHQISCPDQITLDNNSTLNSINVNGQINLLREVNIPTSQDNPFYYEWAFMYALNNVMNNVLENIDDIKMDETQAEAKKNTVKAWAYFWKGFAYSRIGSLYYAGIINNSSNKTTGLYVSRDQILNEAELNLSKAENLLNTLSGNGDYTSMLDALIPSVCKPGKGGTLSTSEWIRNINTLRARNILVNTPAATMSSSQWDQILALTKNGVRTNDNTFTVRSDAQSNLMNAAEYIAARAVGTASNGGGGNKISERLIQDFKPGDKRLDNNFTQISVWVGDPNRGKAFNTRYMIVDKGKGMPGVVVMANRTVGSYELYIAGSYEENILMEAEANIYKGSIDAGLALIDELRSYQGAGLAPVSGTGLNSDQAKEELRRERRVGLAFLGFAFYDARRWGVLENGRSGAVVVDFNGVVNTNAKIDYGYLDYWDVPIAELFYNPPAEGSAPVINPKYE